MKTKKLEIRVSETEYNLVKELSGQEGISNFVRTKLGLDRELSGQNEETVRTKKKIVRTTQEVVRTDDDAFDIALQLNAPKIDELAKEAIKEVKQRGKPNQVCKALGHRFMMLEGKMTCERCGIRA